MKKTVIWSFLGITLLTTIFFFLKEKEEPIKLEPQAKPITIWNVKELTVDTTKKHKESTGQMSIKDYNNEELIKEVDENGEILYSVKSNLNV